MKKIIVMAVLALFVVLPVSARSKTPDERKARKIEKREQRQLQRAVMDSIRNAHAESDSVNVGYGYTKRKNK